MSASLDTQKTIRSLSQEGYKYGFVTDIEAESAPPGLDEDTVRFISAKKGEPEWLLDWRLAAFRAWREMTEPEWAKVEFPPIDFQSASLLRMIIGRVWLAAIVRSPGSYNPPIGTELVLNRSSLRPARSSRNR